MTGLGQNFTLEAHFCNSMVGMYVHNHTTWYSDGINDPSRASATVIMLVLAGLFFNLNLFSRFSNASAILQPKVRLFLSSTLPLFLPVMSYLFSETKKAGSLDRGIVDHGKYPDLSGQASMILLWMLLVELLRKKVDEVRMRGYSGTLQRVGRVVWLGSLVFFNLKRVGRKALFGVLWVLCATKVVQRIGFTEIGKRSYAHGKNTLLINSYMSQILQQDPPQDDQQHRHQSSPSTHINVEPPVADGDDGETMLKRCKLIVMGEEDLIIKPKAGGYKLKDVSLNGNVLTVGKMWDHAFTNLDQGLRLKRLCLSMALFKLLRRRFEHLPPATKAEARECRDLLFNGVYHDRTENAAAVLFQVMNDEVNFLCEYYHSVIPVVLASPFFFLANYFLLPVVVLGMCIMTVVLCGHGNVHYVLSYIVEENFAISVNVVDTTMCLIIKSFTSTTAFFLTVHYFITLLLLAIFLYEEIWEFIVLLLSNWFMLSLLHNYVTKRRWQDSPRFSRSVEYILGLERKKSRPILGFKQFSLLSLRWPLLLGMPSMFSLVVQTAPVPNKAKHAIVESLMTHVRDRTSLSNGSSVLANRDDLLPACRSESIAEVILTWHVATTIMEAQCSPDKRKQSKVSQYQTVATRLSRYCAYLVAFHPELLPDNQDNTEHVFEAAMAELKGVLGCASYYLSCRGTRVDKITQVGRQAEWKDGEVVHDGAKLGNLFKEEAVNDGGLQTWKLLADVWTELVVYLAPSSEEEQVMGHESMLVQGGEFITMLWALTTHTGITRMEK